MDDSQLPRMKIEIIRRRLTSEKESLTELMQNQPQTDFKFSNSHDRIIQSNKFAKYRNKLVTIRSNYEEHIRLLEQHLTLASTSDESENLLEEICMHDQYLKKCKNIIDEITADMETLDRIRETENEIVSSTTSAPDKNNVTDSADSSKDCNRDQSIANRDNDLSATSNEGSACRPKYAGEDVAIWQTFVCGPAKKIEVDKRLLDDLMMIERIIVEEERANIEKQITEVDRKIMLFKEFMPWKDKEIHRKLIKVLCSHDQDEAADYLIKNLRFDEDEFKWAKPKEKFPAHDQLMMDLYQKKLANPESVLGINRPEIIIIKYELANLYMQHGQIDDAVICYEQLLESIKQPCTILREQYFVAVSGHLAFSYLDLDKNEDAKRICEACLIAQVFTMAPPDIRALMHCIYGVVLGRLGISKEAIEALNVSLDIYKNINHTVGAAACLYYLSIQHSNEFRYSEAKSALNECLETQSKLFRSNNESLLETMGWQASFCVSQKMCDEAEQISERLLEISKHTTRDPFEIASTMETLARIFVEQSKLDEAVKYFKKALELMTNPVNYYHFLEKAHLLLKYGSVLETQERFDEAEIVYEEALSIRLQRRGESHPAVATAWRSIGVLLSKRQRFREAEQAFGKCLAILWNREDDHEQATVDAVSDLVFMYTQAGKCYDVALLQRTLGYIKKFIVKKFVVSFLTTKEELLELNNKHIVQRTTYFDCLCLFKQNVEKLDEIFKKVEEIFIRTAAMV